MTEQLAYSYRATCSILESHGFTLEEIENFLVKNQNQRGYIASDVIDEARKARSIAA